MAGERSYASPGFIAAMVVLGASGVVIVVVAAIFISWCIWKYSRNSREPAVGNVQRNRIRELEIIRAMDNGGREIHRVVSVGVPPGFILTLPFVRYSKNGAHLVSIDAKGHMSECPVCLCEYRDGERVRLLPNCKHIFHPKCLNTWLESHTTCPLCRTDVQLARKGKSQSSLDRILSIIRRSGGGGWGAHVGDSSSRDPYSNTLEPVTVVTPPPQQSTLGQLTREPFSRPVSREIQTVHIGPGSSELQRVNSSDGSAPPSSSALQAGMIFSSVWGPYVDLQTSGTSCSSSSGVGFSQVSLATMPSSEDASTSATGFVTISLDPDQSER